MRQDEAFFGSQELVLLYIAKRLKEAQSLEGLFDGAGIDYLVEPDTYRGGFIFVSERIGAFFYAAEKDVEAARNLMRSSGYAPYNLDQ